MNSEDKNKEIENKLSSILEDVFPSMDIETLEKSKPFVDQVSYDSLGQMTLLIQIKNKLGVVITPMNMESMKTFNSMLELILHELEKKGE